MFHKVKAVNALPDYRLSVQFVEGETKIYESAPYLQNGSHLRRWRVLRSCFLA